MRLDRFLAELGSKKGAPGGGAAAALTGASGAALVEMVARLNDKRSKRASGSAEKAASMRVKMLGLIVKDVKAFGRIQKLYRVRKDKKGAWTDALKAGALVPLDICACCASAARLAVKEKPRTSAWLESDRREALILLRAGFQSAALNVAVNLKGLTDHPGFTDRIEARIKKWQRKLPRS